MLKLSLEAVPNKTQDAELYIECDAEGLSDLINQLSFLSNGNTDHVHFFIEDWGEGSIESNIGSVDKRICHLKISLVDP